MAVHTVQPELYSNQLNDKIDRLTNSFARFTPPQLEIFESPRQHYRMRAEFKVWQEGDTAHYAMYQQGEYKKPYIIDQFEVGSETINQLMPKLLAEINASELLRRRLFQVEFLTTLKGEALITLIYHKPLCEQWQALANEVQKRLNIDIIGRSRKQKCVLNKDYVTEELNVHGNTYRYQQVEASFTQPNAHICEAMLEWAVDCAKHINATDSKRDLLELYCGNGNFTIPLSFEFPKVLATEISKTSVNSANYNFNLNQVKNCKIARMSSEEFSEAMDGVREFRRLKDIDLTNYDFGTVLVDPPRAGLDDHTCSIVQGFDAIIYVSCNPETLEKNLEQLSKTHNIERFALFDQFPYTHHIEAGVLLLRK